MPRAQWDQEKCQEIKERVVDFLEGRRNNLPGAQLREFWDVRIGRLYEGREGTQRERA